MVLYRKYRPQVLSDVIGQDHVRDPLLAALKSGKITHAYLFTGPRGTGKTSVARILAKAVNCVSDPIIGEPCNKCPSCNAITNGSHLDLLEIDAASNRGIDEIRDLREKIKLSPAQSKYKVYIIDEAHMLTPEAFNALLKTLEEPPEHAIFVLATTEPQKIPATIASRSTRFDFKVPNVAQIKEKLFSISEKEGWDFPEKSLEEIAKMAGGAFRDGEVLLEKVASYDPAADLEKTREVLGKKEVKSITGFINKIVKGDPKEALVWLDNYIKDGGGVRILTESVLETLRKILLLKAGAVEILIDYSEEDLEELKNLAEELSKERLLKLTDLFNRVINELRDATIPQLPIELLIVEYGLESIQEGKIDKVEKSLEGNNVTHNDANTLVSKDNRPKEISEPVKEEIREKPRTEKTNVKQDKLLQKIQNKWTQFLKGLKPLNSSLELFLRQAKPIDLDDNLLIIEFVYRFHKEKVEERKYREVIEKALEEFTGVPLRIKGVVSQKPQEPKKIEKKKVGDKEENIDPINIFGRLD